MGLGGKHRLGQLRTRLVVGGSSTGINVEALSTAAGVLAGRAYYVTGPTGGWHLPAGYVGESQEDIDAAFVASPVTPADKVELAKLKHPSIAEKVAPKKRKAVAKKPARKAKKK